jgi:hypothetical protein
MEIGIALVPDGVQVGPDDMVDNLLELAGAGEFLGADFVFRLM